MRYFILPLLLVTLPTLAAQPDPYRACTEAKGTYEQCRVHLGPESRARLDKWHASQKQQAEASHKSSQRAIGQPYRGKQ